MTPLAVFLPEVGLASETFIRWDLTTLVPGGTVVVADPPPGGLSQHGQATWTLDDQPALIFEPMRDDPPPSRERVQKALSFLDIHGVEVVLVEYLDFADRWFDALKASGRRIWLRGHGVDVSARPRDARLAAAYHRYEEAEGIIVPSHHAADSLRRIGLPAAKLHVVRYPVETCDLSPRAGRSDVRCIGVGRLVPKKEPLATLAAFRRASLAEPKLVLDLVGDGPLMGDVRAYVTAWNLGDRVHIHGRLTHDRTLELLRGADILLHHAVTAPDGDTEGQPLAVLEAMAAGLAVVSTNHAGIPEIVTSNISGRLVDEHDVAAMADAILDLARDRATRRRLGEAARAAISREHTAVFARARLRQLLRIGEG